MSAVALRVDGVRYEQTALVIEGTLELDEYEELLAGLGVIARGHQWWIGDALIYGEGRYGPEHFQIAEVLQLAPQTMSNYAWVAGAVERSRRREDLTWSHHAEIARLKPAQQIKALAKAADKEWTVMQLRDYVAITWPTGDVREPLPGLEAHEEPAVQKRIEELDRRFNAGEELERGDVGWLLSMVKRLTRGIA